MKKQKWLLTPTVLLALLLLAGCEEKTQTEQKDDPVADGGQAVTIIIGANYQPDWFIDTQIVNDRDKLSPGGFEWRLFVRDNRIATSTDPEPTFFVDSDANRSTRCEVHRVDLHIERLIEGYILAQQPDRAFVNVAAANPDGCAISPPFATFTSTMNCEFRELAVDASRSTGDGRLEYGWDFGDGGTSTREKAVHRYADDGPFNVELTVTNEGGKDTDQEMITVVGPAIAKISRTIDGLCVGFDSGASLGTVRSVVWRFGDSGGNSSTKESPRFCYDAAGTFTVRLDVTNECSTETALDTIEVG